MKANGPITQVFRKCKEAPLEMPAALPDLHKAIELLEKCENAIDLEQQVTNTPLRYSAF